MGTTTEISEWSELERLTKKYGELTIPQLWKCLERLESAPAGELVSRAEALAATMRIGCPSSYCVCSVQIADAIRALPPVARVPEKSK